VNTITLSDDLATRTAEIVEHLDPEWQVSEVHCTGLDDTRPYWIKVSHASDERISFSVQTHDRRYRIGPNEIRHKWGNSPHWPHAIGASTNKSAAQVARDIERRLLGPLMQAATDALMKLEIEAAAEAAQAEAAEQIAECGGANVKHEYSDPTRPYIYISAGNNPHASRIEFKPSYGGEYANITGSVTTAEACLIAKILRESRA
jgi:hypothetical protein